MLRSICTIDLVTTQCYNERIGVERRTSWGILIFSFVEEKQRDAADLCGN